jgi:hypothetical protein
MVTFVAAAPRAGLNKPILGAVREDAMAGATPRHARPAIAAAASTPWPAIRLLMPIWHHNPVVQGIPGDAR